MAELTVPIASFDNGSTNVTLSYDSVTKAVTGIHSRKPAGRRVQVSLRHPVHGRQDFSSDQDEDWVPENVTYDPREKAFEWELFISWSR